MSSRSEYTETPEGAHCKHVDVAVKACRCFPLRRVRPTLFRQKITQGQKRGGTARMSNQEPGQAPSPLTQLLHDARPHHNALIEARDYAGAKELRAKCFSDAAKVKEQLTTEIVQRHDAEKRRLSRAKTLALAKAKVKVAKELDELAQLWADKEASHALRQGQRFELFERQVRTREVAKPVVLSAYVRDLQRSEKRLADFHEYDEAAMVLHKIKYQEVFERERAHTNREQRVDRTLELKRRQMEEEEASRRAMAKNAHHIAKFRAAQEEERVGKQFEHVERDMVHAQSLELRTDPLLKAYERPMFLKKSLARRSSPTSGSPSSGGATTHAGTRGTEYLMRLQGSKYAIPSLCERYAAATVATPPVVTYHMAQQALVASGLPPVVGSGHANSR